MSEDISSDIVLRDGAHSGQLTWPIFKGWFKFNSGNSKNICSGDNIIKKISGIMFSFAKSIDSNIPYICPINVHCIFRCIHSFKPHDNPDLPFLSSIYIYIPIYIIYTYIIYIFFSEKTEAYNGRMWLSQCHLLCPLFPDYSLLSTSALRFLHFRRDWVFVLVFHSILLYILQSSAGYPRPGNFSIYWE